MKKIVFVAFLLIAVSLTGCINKGGNSSDDGNVSPSSNIKWLTYEEGMHEANESNKVVFLYMCSPSNQICKSFENDILSDNEIAKKLEEYIPIKVHLDDSKNENLIYEYRLNYIPFVPTVIFIYNGKILHRLVAYDVYSSDTQEAINNLIENMNKALDKEIWGRDFTFQMLDGQIRQLKDYRGKVTIVDLMATWCNPCRRQMGELEKILDHYGNKINIISIDVEQQDDAEKIRNTFGDHINSWDFGMDKYGIAQKYLLQQSIPTLVIFDKYGRLQYLFAGLIQAQNLINIIDEIME